jgi:hypothetical protein
VYDGRRKKIEEKEVKMKEGRRVDEVGNRLEINEK